MGNWQKMAQLADIPEGGALRVETAGDPIALFRLNGCVFATADTCTHGNASLADGEVIDDTIECPLHRGSFHIPTGRAVEAPCSVDLRSFATRIEGQWVMVES
jgi:nitrite reductase/ring-hydroxylating ferredoxin subunit